MSVFQLFDLTGKVALITGGGRGLGKQMAEAYADAGCDIIVCSRKLENCEDTAAALKEKGVRTKAFACDVTNEEDVDRVVQEVIEEFGKIDVLVNNSGATWGADVEEMPVDAWDKVMNVNVKGTFLMSQKVGKHMIENQSGKIINISSVAGVKAEPPEVLNAIGYSTSKAAVIHFTKDLARKWAHHGIYVNSIAPGFFPSKMTKAVLENRGDTITSNIPLKRIGDENMLKGAALYLASSASDFVTGHTILVDGGAHL
ncbi:SDR family oxidoreductase [Desertibacillus haloalkaliphilus]|uniref:SDR family oxidoreductase n=1 Tax=Desertibacillus haloalkaliphilus TaxID=1328930 RepID=UPI001C269D80|nr:SDR family oxidoreductase [Desertibacillus haloalkaliphilus]MBU8906098.1 SDR family oxidoreductase [Desertibacillus haloalkaliphilus]